MIINQLDSLSIRDMRAVVLLADLRHFNRAAKLCSISQPALSACIKRVEETLQVKLFDRSSRSCTITSDGERVVSVLRELTSSAKKLLPDTTSHAPLAGAFHLGFIPTIGPYYWPQILERFYKQYKKIALTLSEATTEQLLQMIVERYVDAALLSAPIHHPRILFEPIFQEKLLLAVPASHPYAKRKAISISDISEKELLLMEQGHCLRSHVLESCKRNEEGTTTVHATSLLTVLYMVQADAGYTIIPEMAAKKHSIKGVQYIPFKSPMPTRTIGVASLREGSSEGDVRELVGFLKKLVRST